MKKYIFIASVALGVAFSSCDDFLDRKPLDFGNEGTYFKTADDLKMSVNDFYDALPKNSQYWGGIWTMDNNSDNQIARDGDALLYEGEKRTPKIADSQWNFSRLRSINFFINTTERRYNSVKGSQELIDHYLGEGYFFRAYEYFRLLRNFGDVPVFTEVLPDDPGKLAAASKRTPRNEVARFILTQLDSAANKMQDVAPESGRITRRVALALKSRVALYEGTFERYHSGTCFVPGNAKWVGAKTWPNFEFKAGSAEQEVEFFLQAAMEAAKLAADGRSLDNGYAELFNRWEAPFADDSEVLLARYCLEGVNQHSTSSYLNAGGGCGVTHEAVCSYLMESGKPIYADADYKGDKQVYYQMMGRDPRLTSSVRTAGRVFETTQLPDGTYHNDTIIFFLPNITETSNQGSSTGYNLEKYVCRNNDLQIQQSHCTTAIPLFRLAECYLNYIEACYELTHKIDGTAEAYWKEIRTRAGIEPDFNITIANTDMSQERNYDLATTSKNVMVDATLYNIRRERRCEMLAEGLRRDDLTRWRSLDAMVRYQPHGFNLWEEMAQYYTANGKKLDYGIVSQAGDGNYICPLRTSATAKAYDGYNFPKPHYLEPIPTSEFLLTVQDGKSTLYQNPGWPDRIDGTADYGYDCD